MSRPIFQIFRINLTVILLFICHTPSVLYPANLLCLATDTCNDDLACITMASHDRLGLEAIKSLHSQLDDDANGNVDLSESDDVRIFIHRALENVFDICTRNVTKYIYIYFFLTLTVFERGATVRSRL